MTTNTPAAGEPSEREAICIEDLSMFWRGRAKALRILDGQRSQSDAATIEAARVYEECESELERARAALNAPTLSPSVMINRERFETWCVSVHGYLAPPKWNDEENDYVGAEAQMMWDVWNAAIIAHAPSPSEAHRAAAEEIEAFPNWADPLRENRVDRIAAIIVNAQPGDSAGFVLTEEERVTVDEVHEYHQYDGTWISQRVGDLLAIISRAIGAKS